MEKVSLSRDVRFIGCITCARHYKSLNLLISCGTICLRILRSLKYFHCSNSPPNKTFLMSWPYATKLYSLNSFSPWDTTSQAYSFVIPNCSEPSSRDITTLKTSMLESSMVLAIFKSSILSINIACSTVSRPREKIGFSLISKTKKTAHSSSCHHPESTSSLMSRKEKSSLATTLHH